MFSATGQEATTTIVILRLLLGSCLSQPCLALGVRRVGRHELEGGRVRIGLDQLAAVEEPGPRALVDFDVDLHTWNVTSTP